VPLGTGEFFFMGWGANAGLSEGKGGGVACFTDCLSVSEIQCVKTGDRSPAPSPI